MHSPRFPILCWLTTQRVRIVWQFQHDASPRSVGPKYDAALFCWSTQGVKLVIASFERLFGQSIGLQLREWCISKNLV